MPKLKRAVTETLDALWSQLQKGILGNSSEGFTQTFNQFEIFGYDFMIDDDLDVYLIEVNTNPCLETVSCPLMQRLIP